MKTYFLIALAMMLISAAFAEKEVSPVVKELLASDADLLTLCPGCAPNICQLCTYVVNPNPDVYCGDSQEYCHCCSGCVGHMDCP
uniref:Ec-3 pheromone n=1 Tax=Euplotes crassus TaxID=5936 RepID=A0A023SGL2_EUPCR|nr:Ec-3 pheromone precursor [Moneuplotes crassus]